MLRAVLNGNNYNYIGIGAFNGKTDETEAIKTLTHAADHGVTFWNCADCYGDSM